MRKSMFSADMHETVRIRTKYLIEVGKTKQYKGTNFTANIHNLIKSMCQAGASNCGVPDYWKELYPGDLLRDI